MSRPAISIVGAPTDVGASVRGASMGPEALRVAGLAAALARIASDVRDLGNLAGPLNPALDHRNTTAALAVDLAESLFGKSTLIRA